MRTESRKFRKSYTWPRVVMKKWLNIRCSSNEFLSDSNDHGGVLERRGSCSEEDNGFLITRNSLGSFSLSLRHGGWLVNSSIPDPNPPAAQTIRVFVGTWNVGGKSPHGGLNLKDWFLSSTPQLADVYVVGFQEIVPLNAGNVLGAEDQGPSSTWLHLIHRVLASNDKASDELFSINSRNDDEDRYHLMASKQMVGIFLCVWARAKIAKHVRNVKASCVGTGIMGYLGNKGSVSISMTIRRSTFCFVCSHLSSGEKEGDEIRRNSDISEILRRTRFSRDHRATGFMPSTILEHDKIILLGDLNYRLATGFNGTHELLKKDDWQILLERDQLGIERRSRRILRGWNEGNICFPPTYKYLTNSDRYVFTATKTGEKRRSPAWCDRILWRGKGMKQMSYARFESQFSDHRPVQALFSVEVDDYDRLETKIAAANTCSSNGSPLSKVQADELLVITRTRSCFVGTTRF